MCNKQHAGKNGLGKQNNLILASNFSFMSSMYCIAVEQACWSGQDRSNGQHTHTHGKNNTETKYIKRSTKNVVCKSENVRFRYSEGVITLCTLCIECIDTVLTTAYNGVQHLHRAHFFWCIILFWAKDSLKWMDKSGFCYWKLISVVWSTLSIIHLILNSHKKSTI